MRTVSATTAAWFAGINTFVSTYVLWTYYRALQYVPATGDPVPPEVLAIQMAVLAFEALGLVLCIVYLAGRRQAGIRKAVQIICLVQLLVLFLTPFLIAARTWPRV